MKQLKPVIDSKFLHKRPKSLILGLFYGLYSRSYGFPLWLDIFVGTLLVLMFIGDVAATALEVDVHPKDLP